MGLKHSSEDGMMTVEAVLSMVPFIIAILGITSFINIFVVHNKIQYALYQMGNELSCYTYFYQALGVRSADLGLKDDIDTQTQPLDQALDDLGAFIRQIGILEGGADSGDLAIDPNALIRSFIYLGIEKAEETAKTLLVEILSQGLMEIYLDERFASYHPMSADEYLKYFGVRDGIDGLDFSESRLFSDDDYQMIDLVVEYDLEIYILKLFFKDPSIHVVQRCSVPAWLDGDGVTYLE